MQNARRHLAPHIAFIVVAITTGVAIGLVLIALVA